MSLTKGKLLGIMASKNLLGAPPFFSGLASGEQKYSLLMEILERSGDV
jgi:hypothetical protein